MLWSGCPLQKNFANFLLLHNLDLEENFKVDFNQHLERLRKSFDGNFSPGDLKELEIWITVIFTFNLEIEDEDEDKEHLTKMEACQAKKLLKVHLKLFGTPFKLGIKLWQREQSTF